MHKKFDHQAIEKKWQKKWAEDGLYNVGERDTTKEKEYVLVEWPYPSGNLHIGHWYAFAVPDIYARYKRMLGKQVLYPFGFDAFGLPAENAALKHGKSPREWTEGNIAHMREQLASMGAAFSWDKTCSSTDPEYYKWTQWMFTKFFEDDIAYRGEGTVNWCPHDNTVIANEQVHADGTCDRCGNLIEKKKMPQWMLRITDFADDLIDDLESLQWPEFIKEAQRNWIGRSQGAEIDFELSIGEKVTVFTTRPDTLYGATYLVLAPEHELVEKHKDTIANWSEVDTYINDARQRDEQDRLDAKKEKTGVRLEGVIATNPASGEQIPVFIADYVLAGYGTGAIMAVPAHDERDNEFARKFNLPIKEVVVEIAGTPHPESIFRKIAIGIIENDKGEILIQTQKTKDGVSYCLPGGGVDEGETYEDATIREVEEETGYYDFKDIRSLGKNRAFYFHSVKKLYREALAETFVLKLNSNKRKDPALTEEEQRAEFDHEWVSPKTAYELLLAQQKDGSEDIVFIRRYIESFNGVYNGVGSLINSAEFDGMNSEEAKVAITEKVGGRMTNTYRLRDWSIGRQRYWGVPIPIVYDPEGKAHPVPVEHLPWTLPEDVDVTPTGVPPLAKSEELKKRTIEIFGEGWTPEVETMDTFVDSSWYFLRYVDNKNDMELASEASQQDWMQVDTYFGGAEHTTMHLLYSRFWQKALHKLGLAIHNEPYVKRYNRSLIMGPDGQKMSKSKGNVVDPDEHVARVGSDSVKMYLAFMGPYAEVNHYPFDLGGIAGIRRFLERVYGLSEHISKESSTTKLLHKTIKKVRSDIEEYKFNTAISAMMIYVNEVEKQNLSQDEYRIFLKLLAPFAPHVTEELWSIEGNHESIHTEVYPEFDAQSAKDDVVTIGVQINGKVRGEITISPEASEEQAWEAVEAEPSLMSRIKGMEIKKRIYVPGRILNVIVQ